MERGIKMKHDYKLGEFVKMVEDTTQHNAGDVGEIVTLSRATAQVRFSNGSSRNYYYVRFTKCIDLTKIKTRGYKQ